MEVEIVVFVGIAVLMFDADQIPGCRFSSTEVDRVTLLLIVTMPACSGPAAANSATATAIRDLCVLIAYSCWCCVCEWVRQIRARFVRVDVSRYAAACACFAFRRFRHRTPNPPRLARPSRARLVGSGTAVHLDLPIADREQIAVVESHVQAVLWVNPVTALPSRKAPLAAEPPAQHKVPEVVGAVQKTGLAVERP